MTPLSRIPGALSGAGVSLTAHYIPQWPEQLNPSAMERLQLIAGYVTREIDGATIAEPASGVGPAYVQDPESGWWRYVYDVAMGC